MKFGGCRLSQADKPFVAVKGPVHAISHSEDVMLKEMTLDTSTGDVMVVT